MASPRGTEFLIWQCPPLSDLDRMTPQQRARALSPKGMLDAAKTDEKSHPGMHATNTVDYLVVLSGELTLILEEGEVTLKTGDTLVDRGVSHAWENRGSEPALCAIVNLGAKPLA
jgi:mannose-6-phosphate isomerase-like protein (cupin superfamily)